MRSGKLNFSRMARERISLTATQRTFLKVGRRPALSGMSGGERALRDPKRAPLRTPPKKPAATDVESPISVALIRSKALRNDFFGGVLRVAVKRSTGCASCP